MPDSKESIDALRKVNGTLRAMAQEQAARIGTVRRHLMQVHATTAEAIWRNFALNVSVWGAPNPTPVPPREIPQALLDEFTLNGRADVIYNYLDGTYPDNWPIVYTDAQIDFFLKRIARRQWFIYGMTDVWMWEAIAEYPVRNLDVANMGSLTPWYESTCLYFGARPTTIDYNRIVSRSDRIKTMTVAEWDRDQPRFDAAWSISSFEHDGLGMYGDPLDPNGDLKTMQKMKRLVKPGGLLFLSVPVGKDRVFFNNHRIYGRFRLERLHEGWKLLKAFGMRAEDLEGPGHLQPLFILQNI
jgi:hypothetical protein